ncbi:hypothetical protein SKAU_G00254620, partial [Synaphobranchus kaupii]
LIGVAKPTADCNFTSHRLELGVWKGCGRAKQQSRTDAVTQPCVKDVVFRYNSTQILSPCCTASLLASEVTSL